MSKAHKIVAVVGMVLFVVAAGYAQSLGDVAREQRQKQAKASHVTSKVVTNEDLPASEQPSSSTSVSDEHDTTPAAPASNDIQAAEQWKAKIQSQRDSVASLQDQIDKVNASIHFAGPNCVANCVQHNEKQIEKQDEVERIQ